MLLTMVMLGLLVVASQQCSDLYWIRSIMRSAVDNRKELCLVCETEAHRATFQYSFLVMYTESLSVEERWFWGKVEARNGLVEFPIQYLLIKMKSLQAIYSKTGMTRRSGGATPSIQKNTRRVGSM